jgi:hypothetical protein
MGSEAERVTMVAMSPLYSSFHTRQSRSASASLNTRLYDENPELIKRYFYCTYKQILDNCANASSESDCERIYAAKAEVWTLTKPLSEAENGLKTLRMVRWTVIIRTVMAVVSATLLNLPNSGMILAGSLYLYVHSLNMFIRWARQWQKADLKLYAHLLEEYRAQEEKKLEDDRAI